MLFSMKRSLAILWPALVLATVTMNAAPREDLWKQVDDAIGKGLPRSAITHLETIVTGAIQDRAWGEATKAIARKIVLEGNIEGNKPEEKITRMEAQIAAAPGEIIPLLRTVQAHWFWHYFQQNRWRFLRRTTTSQSPGPDIATWDLARIFAEIDRVFRLALSAPADLQRIPVSQFEDVLAKGTVPDSYRPTLYDFIAQEALKFYTSGEQAGARPEDAFEVQADSPALGPLEEFLAWPPPGSDTNAPAYRAIGLFQDLLRFHQNDPDPAALIDADLARLVWAGNAVVGEDKDKRYLSALRRFAERWAAHEISALALSHWARALHNEGDLVEARRLALRGARAHPESAGGRLCHNLVQEIEAKSAQVTTERVWNAPWPSITVRYRNVTNVYFRMVAWDWNDFLDRRHRRPEDLSEQERAEMMRRQPALEWHATLPPTADYKERQEKLAAPSTLKPGFYFIVASHDPNFRDQDNQLSFTDVWVSDLGLIVLARQGQVSALVLDARTGEPLAGAEVVAWYLDANGNRVRQGVPQRTDAQGWASFSSPDRPLLLRARANGHELGSMEQYQGWREEKTRPNDQVAFFTDRAIYRPGQTVSYKGIAIHVDLERDRYEPLSGRVLEVAFVDPNGKEVAKTRHRANDYGSFSGSFTAPRDRVTGQYQLVARVGVNFGMTTISVEEYKRPKFQVSLDAPKTAPRLNDTVALTGKAEAYTGAPIDAAQVKWRVVREVRWPDWWGWSGGRGWRGGIPGDSSQEIAHGITQTRLDGGFTLEFKAKPDPQVDESSEASFHFRVYADVTDSAGETRSDDRAIHVGFVALRASIDMADWQTVDKPVELDLRTTTLDGEPQSARGTLKVVRLQEPARVQRPPLAEARWPVPISNEDGSGDLSNPRRWPEGETVLEQSWTTAATGKAQVRADLGAGVYRALLESEDRFGKKVTARRELTVLRPSSDTFPVKVPSRMVAPNWNAEPGEEWMGLWGTGYSEGRAFVEVEHRGTYLQRYWTEPGVTQSQIKQVVNESMRGGFTVHVTQVRENRAYFHSQRVEVPWSNKELELSWEHFVSRLQPGQSETWTAVIKPRPREAKSADPAGPLPQPRDEGGNREGPETPGSAAPATERVAAELVATLYDASLDQFRPHHWMKRFASFRRDTARRRLDFGNVPKSFRPFASWKVEMRDVDRSYRQFPDDLVANFWGYGWPTRVRAGRALAARYGLAPQSAEMLSESLAATALPSAPAPGAVTYSMDATLAKASLQESEAGSGPPQTPSQSAPKPDLAQVSPRRNLTETAFFWPHLATDANGVVRMTFKMPESLTQWRFLGFAHDKQLRSGLLEDYAVTAKDLMVQPNPPRFLREGDTLEFTVKVSNQSAARQTGQVRLNLAQADTDGNLDALLGNTRPELDFDIPAHESRSFSWRLVVPDGAPFLIYRAVASTGRLSDGEEGYLPVLSRRVLVTESLPLPIRVKAGQGQVEKQFEFTKLIQSNQSDTLVHENLVAQMVSNPAWYAVLALPYLMEYPHQCTEQVFNRLYANELARHIAGSDPKIRRLFDSWKNTPALDSPLEKNQDLKAVLLEETPWWRQAQNESQARKNIGILFDDNRLDAERQLTLRQLTEGQQGDGAWPWFPGGRGNDYITLYIATGFGRLRHLGANVDVSLAVKALRRLDGWMDERFHEIQKSPRPEEYVLSPIDALYLYGRSFFLKDLAVDQEHQDAFTFYLAQARTRWLRTSHRQSQGHLALALKRWGGPDNLAAARDIMKSIKERSVASEEMGMFWRDLELGWWWYRAPIETQALMIEAFDEVMADQDAVEECRVWLLKQKQTQDWKTTKATADAVYALLLRGKDLLSNRELVDMTAGSLNLTARARETDSARRADARAGAAVEPGTGFFEVRFHGKEITPELGRITLRKSGEGPAWGSLHWQYFEDVAKVTPHADTPLKLKKTLFKKVNSARGPQLEPVQGPLAVGDELVVRIELRSDRDMEYVHLKDHRGSGAEPVNVLSRHQYQDGLAYYESTRDTASHFFIEYLPKGVFVFEYSARLQHRGAYQTGLASIQCLYAPEFNSHSESHLLTVQ